MSPSRLVLALHIAAGALGLILGPIAMAATKRPGLHTRTGEVYHWVVLLVCATAGLLALSDWQRNGFFLPVAVGSYAFAVLGYVSAKRRWPGWLRAHLAGQGGSYIAMVTALLLVNWQTLTGSPGPASVWAWTLPTVAGTPIIAWVIYQVRLGTRPRL